MVDDLNNIWLNSSNKLIKFDGSTWSIYTDNTSLYFRNILKIKNNIVYLNGANGLIKFENSLHDLIQLIKKDKKIEIILLLEDVV